MHENFKKFTMLEDQPTTASDSTGNTDGEGTQKVSLGELLLNAGTRIVDLEKQSNDQVEIITHLDQELASLREQLWEMTKERDAWISEYNAARAEVES